MQREGSIRIELPWMCFQEMLIMGSGRLGLRRLLLVSCSLLLLPLPGERSMSRGMVVDYCFG